MKPARFRDSRQGLTVIDLVFATSIVALLSVAAVATVSAQGRLSSRVACLRNIKQISLGFVTWADAHEARLPWRVPPKKGTLEWAETTQTFRHFQIASNELTSTGTVVCPEDVARTNAGSFAMLLNENVSYLIGLAATQRRPDTIICGDRTLSTNATKILSGIVEFADAEAATWATGIHPSGGNVGLADGSARQLNQAGLRRQLAVPGCLPTRFSIP